MNLKAGGAQPHQRDTEYTDHDNLLRQGADKKYRQSIGNKGLRLALSSHGKLVLLTELAGCPCPSRHEDKEGACRDPREVRRL